MSITPKGGLFSLDLLVAVLAVFFLTSFLLMILSDAIGFESRQLTRLKLSRKAVTYADRLVKVSSQAISPGLASKETEKHRTLVNRLALPPPGSLRPHDPAIKEVYLDLFLSPARLNLFLDQNQGENCLVVERLVLVEVNGWPEKALLGVKACA
jgi:hypothetical protein